MNRYRVFIEKCETVEAESHEAACALARLDLGGCIWAELIDDNIEELDEIPTEEEHQ